MLKFLLALLALIILAGVGISFFRPETPISDVATETPSEKTSLIANLFFPTPAPTLEPLPPLPSAKTLPTSYHIFQTFNNCGPAAMSMALSHYGIQESQQTLGQSLRPYQNPQGDNDDKSVTLGELAREAEKYDLIPFHRPAGSSELVKQFIAQDMPVITRTWLKPNDDIGHYRVIKGYNDTTQTFIQDDSLQGKNLEYSYQDFDVLWKKFGFEYLVLVPPEKKEIAERILGEDLDSQVAWSKARQQALGELAENPDDLYSRFNLSVAEYYLGNYQQSITEFEKVQSRLPARTLWYQIEPILAYFAVGDYSKVLSLTDSILSNHNRAFSELYLIRGEVYRQQGNTTLATEEFRNAVLYNKNLPEANEKLNSI